MDYKFGIPTDCPKCIEEDERRNAINAQAKSPIPPYTSLNCFCRPGPNWEETDCGWRFVQKDIDDFDNVFNYIEWIGETQIGYEMDFSRWEEIEEYIKGLVLEIDKLEKLLVISSGFPSDFKSIITGEPLWPKKEE